MAAFKSLVDIDRIVHEPARLAILDALDCEGVTFQFLLAETGLRTGALSSHLTKLEAAGLIEIVKGHRGRRSYTDIRLTFAGLDALERHWKCLEEAHKARRSAPTRATSDRFAP